MRLFKCVGSFTTNSILPQFNSVSTLNIPLWKCALFHSPRPLYFEFWPLFYLFFYCSFCSTRIPLLKVKRTRSEVWRQETIDSTRLVAVSPPATSWRLIDIIHGNLLQMGDPYEVINHRLLLLWRNGIWCTFLLPFDFIICVFYFHFSVDRPFSTRSFSWRLDGRVEHWHWGCLHWGWQWRTEIDLSPHHRFPESLPTWSIRRERAEVKLYFQNFSFISIFRAFFSLWTGSTWVRAFASWLFVKVFKVPSHLLNGALLFPTFVLFPRTSRT